MLSSFLQFIVFFLRIPPQSPSIRFYKTEFTNHHMQRCRSLLSIEGNNLQLYPNFALFSTLGGMNFDHDFVQVSKLNEDQKKMSSPKEEHFFPQIQVKAKKKGLRQKWNTSFPQFQVKTKKKTVFTKNGTRFCFEFSGHLHSDAHQSQIIGGDADVDHT